MNRSTLCCATLLGLALSFQAAAQVVINEIMYHPVERPEFNADGSPVLDLYDDVHEFVELHNAGAEEVPLGGWQFSSGISYTFPAGAVLAAGGYVVVAKHPERLKAIPAYHLAQSVVLGPYDGQLSNSGETVRLRDAAGATVDSVSYSAEFPWAISADGLGASDHWTGLRAMDYQYRGRSLERVSISHPSNDPANWLASPMPGEPSPGQPNAVRRSVPEPVVIRFSAVQEGDEAALIRHNQSVRVDCQFTSLAGLSNVRVEWFVDDIEVTNEIPLFSPMTAEGPSSAARFTTVLPGQPDRSVVRFRFRGNRGAGDEVISPRKDDPFQWNAYFVTPVRNSQRPGYDCFISTASLNILQANITQSPRRVTSPDPPGNPRLSWNATQPAIMVADGVVYDIRMRHHGSRYNRGAGRNSFKWQFPRYQKFNGVTGIFQTDKGEDFVVGHGLFRAVGLPVTAVRYVDLHLNNRSVMQRLEQGEFDETMLEEFHRNQQALNPGSPLEPPGEIYKSVGTIDLNGEGPYGRGDGRKLSKLPHWTDLQMYEWTYSLQNHGWRGSYSWKQMIDAFWVARGDSPARLDPNIPALRTFFTEHFDLDAMLTYIALENWCCPWDDTTQNHFFWQRRNGKWCMLPWDNDAWFGRGDNTPATASIFMGEVGDPNNNYRGPNFFKDAFIKTFRQELKERFFLLNNTFLHPDNLTAMGFGSIRTFAQARMASVNAQCGLGVFHRPNKPANLSPSGGGTALPPRMLAASPYGHSATPARPHAKTVWEIRSAAGSYLAPLWKLSSTNDLTATRLPFEWLQFGQTYFWRCTYEDAEGHPSVPSEEASFNFGPSSADVAVLPIDAATAWRYNQSGADLSGTPWTALSYDDSAWPSGPAVLAREDAALPDPIRTQLTLGRTTYYFRKRFDFPGTPEGAVVRLKHLIDDGCVIYLNGQELMRVRMPGGSVDYNTYASQNVDNAAWEGPFQIPGSFLQSGENVVAVEVHQSNANSSDIVFGLTIDATLPAASGSVVLNEIAARNTGSVRNAGATPDWIELYNNGSEAVDLGGYSLSDDMLRPGRFVFPPETRIAARGYLTVWCDSRTDLPGLHTGFGLSDEGQTVALFGPNGEAMAVLDFVTFGLQVADLTIARTTDGAGDWQLAVPSPDAPNRMQDLGPPAGLKINEWMASPQSGEDWFELFNPSDLPVALGGLHLSDDFSHPTKSRLAALSFIGPAGFVRLFADENLEAGADHAGFKLSAGGEVIALSNTQGTALLDAVSFGPQTTGVSEGRLPDGADRFAFFPGTDSPGDPNHLPLTEVVISEILAHTDPPLEDAIELQNVSAAPLDLSGWWLSDSRRQPRKFQIPPGSILAPGQFAVFYEYQFNAVPNAPGMFGLSSSRGDEVVLSEADAFGELTGYRTKADFGATERGVSLGRFPTSIGFQFTALERRTFGADQPATVEAFRLGIGQSNSVAKIGPVVISELMYRPPALGGEDNRRDEFIELHNPGNTPVPLFDPEFPANTWQLRDAVDFAFPPGVTLPARGTLVVVSFDPAIDTATRAEFESVYGPGQALYGPFRGKLDNSGDDVELLRPDLPQTTPGPDLGFVPYILVDRVRYSAASPWPGEASGTGASLTRRDSLAYGNDPVTWLAASPSPGRVEGQSNQPWQLSIQIQSTGALLIQAFGTGAGQAILQTSTDLLTWSDLLTRPAETQLLEYSDDLAEPGPARYYRVALSP